MITLKTILDTIDVTVEKNVYGTQLTKSRIKKASADGRLFVKDEGDKIRIRISSNDPLEQFDFAQYWMTYVG